MIKVLFFFPKSIAADEFDVFLAKGFIPTVRQAPGLRSLQVSSGDLMSPGGPPPYARVIEASFDSLEEMMAHVFSPDNQDNREQMKAFAAQIIYYEVEDL